MKDKVIQLQERAEELGFETVQEALDAGYHVVQDLVADEYSLKKLDEESEALNNEKEEQLDRLDGVIDYLKHEEENYLTKFLIHELKEVEQYIKERV